MNTKEYNEKLLFIMNFVLNHENTIEKIVRDHDVFVYDIRVDDKSQYRLELTQGEKDVLAINLTSRSVKYRYRIMDATSNEKIPSTYALLQEVYELIRTEQIANDLFIF